MKQDPDRILAIRKRIIQLLRRRGPMSASQLTDAVYVNEKPPTHGVRKTLKQLQSLGYIKPFDGGYKRVGFWQATDKPIDDCTLRPKLQRDGRPINTPPPMTLSVPKQKRVPAKKREAIRRRLASDVDAFLANGGKITVGRPPMDPKKPVTAHAIDEDFS